MSDATFRIAGPGREAAPALFVAALGLVLVSTLYWARDWARVKTHGVVTIGENSAPRTTPGASGPPRPQSVGVAGDLPAARVESTPELVATLEALRGRPTLVATWTENSGMELLPELARISRQWPELEVISAHRGDLDRPLFEIAKELGSSIRFFADDPLNRQFMRGLGVTSVPGFLLVDEAGQRLKLGRGGGLDHALADRYGAPVRDGLIVPRVVARLMHDGRPLHEVTRERPRLWMRSDWTYQHREVELEYDSRTSIIQIHDLPVGTWGLSVFVGEFKAWQVLAVGARPPATIPVSVQRIIRLSSPVSTANDLTEELNVESPVHFAWDETPGATSWSWTILAAKGGGAWEMIDGDRTSERRVDVELPVGGPYRFRVAAYSGNGQVGTLSVRSPRGLSSDLELRVVAGGPEATSFRP